MQYACISVIQTTLSELRKKWHRNWNKNQKVKSDTKNETKIKKKILKVWQNHLLFERSMSIVIKTDTNGHDSKFHEYGVTSNCDTCFKNVSYVIIRNKTQKSRCFKEGTTFCGSCNPFHMSHLKNMVFLCISAN